MITVVTWIGGGDDGAIVMVVVEMAVVILKGKVTVVTRENKDAYHGPHRYYYYHLIGAAVTEYHSVQMGMVMILMMSLVLPTPFVLCTDRKPH